jgi:hypothetical protein
MDKDDEEMNDGEDNLNLKGKVGYDKFTMFFPFSHSWRPTDR